MTTSSQPTADYTRESKYVVPEAKYGTYAWYMGIFMGMSGKGPKEIRFRCIMCKETIEVSRDPKVLGRYHNKI